MASPLGQVSLGFLCEGPVGQVSLGYQCEGVTVIDVDHGAGGRKKYRSQKEALHRKRLVREDEELLAVIAAALSGRVIR